MRIYRLWLALVIGLGLTGCAGIPPSDGDYSNSGSDGGDGSSY